MKEAPVIRYRDVMSFLHRKETGRLLEMLVRHDLGRTSICRGIRLLRESGFVSDLHGVYKVHPEVKHKVWILLGLIDLDESCERQ